MFIAETGDITIVKRTEIKEKENGFLRLSCEAPKGHTHSLREVIIVSLQYKVSNFASQPPKYQQVLK